MKRIKTFKELTEKKIQIDDERNDELIVQDDEKDVEPVKKGRKRKEALTITGWKSW
jgi:hypothetical protein